MLQIGLHVIHRHFTCVSAGLWVLKREPFLLLYYPDQIWLHILVRYLYQLVAPQIMYEVVTLKIRALIDK
jgi:hypothetical protein